MAKDLSFDALALFEDLLSSCRSRNPPDVVISQLNNMKFAKMSGSLPENVNFGIKASTVRQFLTSSGLPTKWSDKPKSMSTKDLAKIAKNQAVMVVCHQ